MVRLMADFLAKFLVLFDDLLTDFSYVGHESFVSYILVPVYY